MVRTLATPTLAAGMLLFSSLVSAAPIEAALQLAKLSCLAPTWEGKDHIYILVVAQNAQSQDSVMARLPSPDGHWNMAATPAHNTLEKVSLWSGTLNENAAIDLSIFVMDEDNG